MNIAFCAQKSECMVNIYKNNPIKKGDITAALTFINWDVLNE